MEWIDLAQDRDSWQSFVIAILILWGGIKCELLHDQLKNY